MLIQLDADHSDSMIMTLSETLDLYDYNLFDCFSYVADLNHLTSHKFKQGDKQGISVTHIFKKMTSMSDDISSLMADSPSVIVVIGSNATNMMSMLGKEWQYDGLKYRCVINDDAAIVYEIDDDKVNDD